MNTCKKPSFGRDVKKIIDLALREQVEEAILSVQEAKAPRDIPELKKLKGHKIHYRIKVGRYRIGLTIENNMATFTAFDRRKDFYKYFP